MRTRQAKHAAGPGPVLGELDPGPDADERIQNALLDSVAHDLRTPLVSIQGALACLQDGTLVLNREARQALIENAAEEADRLNGFIGNLLDMAQVEAGGLGPVQEPYDLDYVISSALAREMAALKGRPVRVHVSSRLPPVRMDLALMVKAMAHLLDNAAKYSSSGAPIDVSARRVGATVEVTVSDRGPGIPPSDLTRVFDKFYRVPKSTGVLGTGLGLAISRRIVEAHGGRIIAENRKGGGAALTIILPLAGRRGTGLPAQPPR